MHIAEVVTPKKTTKSSTAKGKWQSHLSFGLYQGHIPGTLKDTELMIWKERYALSDKKFLNIQQAVTVCVKPSQKLLCLQKQREIADDVANDSPEYTSTTDELQLSLDHWVEWQRAPVSTRYIGHSHTTKHLVHVLQFTENISVTPDFVSSYDIEMQTFLNHDDVLPSSPMMEWKIGKRRLCFDSEDEDFVNSKQQVTKKVMRSSFIKNKESCSFDVLQSNYMIEGTSAGDEAVGQITDNISLIPSPPDIDALDGMDQWLLSQSPDRKITVSPQPVNYSTPLETAVKIGSEAEEEYQDGGENCYC